MVFLQLLHPVLHDMLLPMSRTALLKLHVRYPYHTLALLVRRACQVSIMSIAVMLDMLLSDGSSVPVAYLLLRKALVLLLCFGRVPGV